MSAELDPGSDAARKAGCKCPVIDNSYGRGAYGGGIRDENGKVLFWKSELCPLHGGDAPEPVRSNAAH